MEMSPEMVQEKLQTIFDELFFEPVALEPELSARDVDEWDSLKHISLVIMVEERFKIKFRVGEVESTKNIGEFVALILARQGPSQATQNGGSSYR